MGKYYISNLETKIKIEEYETKEDAITALEQMEKEDKNNGSYEENYYCIRESENNTIIWCPKWGDMI